MRNCEHCRELRLFDVKTGQLLQTLADEADGHAGGSERAQRCYRDVASFSPADDLVLWGNTLWDPRTPRAIHRFDQFTDFSGGVFHPAGTPADLASCTNLHHCFRKASCCCELLRARVQGWRW